jgi:hypothetical protein
MRSKTAFLLLRLLAEYRAIYLDFGPQTRVPIIRTTSDFPCCPAVFDGTGLRLDASKTAAVDIRAIKSAILRSDWHEALTAG